MLFSDPFKSKLMPFLRSNIRRLNCKQKTIHQHAYLHRKAHGVAPPIILLMQLLQDKRPNAAQETTEKVRIVILLS